MSDETSPSLTRLLAVEAASRPRWVSILVGVVLVAGGGLLVIWPLTSLHVLVWFVSLVTAVLGVIAATGIPRQPLVSSIAAVALVILGVGIVVLRNAIMGGLPYAVAPLLVLLAVATAWRAFQPSKTPAERARGLVWAVITLGGAILSWWWPEIAGIALGVSWGITLMVTGFVLLWAPVIARRQTSQSEGRSPQRARAVMQWTGAIAVLALIATVTVGSAHLRSQVPTIGDFYTWDEDLPEAPGMLLRQQPYEGDIPDGAHAVTILYTTTYADGSPAIASGVVLIPDAPSQGERRVVAWQHGTTGVHQTCAPSLSTRAVNAVGIPGVDQMVERGWLVVATDYPGMGTGGKYPYLIGEGEGRSTLDAIRAAASLEGAQPSADIMVWGHSQGGHASLWAAQLTESYAPEFTLTSVVALSSASAPLTLAQGITAKGSTVAGNLATSYVLVPYSHEYDDVSLSATVDPAARALVNQTATYCAIYPTVLAAAIGGLAVTWGGDRPVFDLDLDSGPLRERLEQNTPSGDFNAPLFLGQGADDEVIPIAIQRAFSQEQCAAGRPVVTTEYPGYNHNGVVAEGSPLIDDMLAWADAVIEGETPSNCTP